MGKFPYWRMCWAHVWQRERESGLVMNRLYFIVPAVVAVLFYIIRGLTASEWREGIFLAGISFIVLEILVFVGLWFQASSLEWHAQNAQIEELQEKFRVSPCLEGMLIRDHGKLLLKILNGGEIVNRVWGHIAISGVSQKDIPDAFVVWMNAENSTEVKIAKGETRSIIVAESRSRGALPKAGGRLSDPFGSRPKSFGNVLKEAAYWNWYVKYNQNNECMEAHSESWSLAPVPNASPAYEQEAQNRDSRVKVEIQIFSEHRSAGDALKCSFDLVGRSLIENFQGTARYIPIDNSASQEA